MINELRNKEKTIAVVGLGYVGLPLALALSVKFDVIGYDINEKRISSLAKEIDSTGELTFEDFENKEINFTSDKEDLKKASFFIVAVPTPIDEHKVPDLRPLFGASKDVGSAISKGDIVVYESTVYPGCTEEDCVPIIEKESGLKGGVDFGFGYSPERINPGDKTHTVENITKVVSGNTKEILKVISQVYGTVIHAGIFEAESIKVAEAAKVIENTQRDLNIAFMNELAIIFDKMEIDTLSVLSAASTKWNFLPFYPGLVGGHCIGVDPYYLTYKSQKLGYNPEVILSGRRINDGMPAYIAKTLVQKLLKNNISPQNAKVLVMGITFKEDVSDIRNSKVADLVEELKNYTLEVEVIDPFADPEEVSSEYNIELIAKPKDQYDALILAVSHSHYKNKNLEQYTKLLRENGVLMDLKGIIKEKSTSNNYWRL